MFDARMEKPDAPLYREEFEHDNCGIGACVNINGAKDHTTVENALKIVENLEHRAGKDAERNENTVLVCSSSPRRSFAAASPRRCLRSLWKRKVWSF